jgi:hypothetical protein
MANLAGCGHCAVPVDQIKALNNCRSTRLIVPRRNSKPPIKHDADNTRTRIEQAMGGGVTPWGQHPPHSD